MSDPSVCCTMLVSDRQQMAERAERCFAAQSYRNSVLLILDNGRVPYEPKSDLGARKKHYFVPQRSVGVLRNEACDLSALGGFDIIAHMDSDDYSYPNRITEQVEALLDLRSKSPGVEVIGSSEMMFWRDPEAWRYRDELHTPVCGSLCYWTTAWRRQPFSDCMVGESRPFLAANPHLGFTRRDWVVACIHSSNTNNYAHSLSIDDPHSTSRFWREPEMDDKLRALMEAA